MFIEAILNDTIVSENLSHKLIIDNNLHPNKFDAIKFDFDLYQDKISFYDKIHVLFKQCGKIDYEEDSEFIELKHLVSIRNSVAHLKPITQKSNGLPERKISKAALNYLANKKIVVTPFDIGIYWIDCISKKEVAEWSLKVLNQTILYLYESTFNYPVGIQQLDFYCLKLKLGKYSNN